MAKAPKLSAPPAPTPPPSNDVLPVVTGEALTPPNGVEGGTPNDDSGDAALNRDLDGPHREAPEPTPPHDAGSDQPFVPPTPKGDGRDAAEGGTVLKNGLPDHTDPSGVTEDDGEPVQPEIGGKLITDADAGDGYGLSAEQVAALAAEEDKRKASVATADAADDEQTAMAEEAFQSLIDEPFDPSTNLGDWDNDGKAGGAVPAPKDDSEKTNAELGEEVGIAHAQFVADGQEKPKRDDIKNVLNAKGEGKLPNGKAPDDEFWTAYDQAFDREVNQLAADVLDDDERLRRIEKTLGLLSPRQ